MTTDLDLASDAKTSPEELASVLTRWKSSRSNDWAIAHALTKNAALSEESLLDLAWSCQAGTVFNPANFLLLFADPGLGDRLIGAICRPGPTDERPRDPELFQGFCAWLAEGTDVPDWLAEAAFHQHALRHALMQGTAPYPLVTPRARMAFEAICRNPNVALPNPRPKDEIHRTQLLMLLSGATDLHAAQLPDVEAVTRSRFFGHPLWKRVDGATAMALDAGRPDIDDPLPSYLREAWPAFAVAQGWMDTFHFPESWDLKRRINFVRPEDEDFRRKDLIFGADIFALREEIDQAKADLAQPSARDARAALRKTERGREIRHACLFAMSLPVARIAALLAEAKETEDDAFVQELFIASKEFLGMGSADPKRLAETEWPPLRAAWTRFEEPRVAQLEAAMDTCVRIGIALYRIASAKGREDAIHWEKSGPDDRSHTVFRIDTEGPAGFSWDLNADDPKVLAALESLRPSCSISVLRKALKPFATEALANHLAPSRGLFFSCFIDKIGSFRYLGRMAQRSSKSASKTNPGKDCLLAEAQDPTTPKQRLMAIRQSADRLPRAEREKLLVALAGNAACPHDLLLELARICPHEVVRNPALLLELLSDTTLAGKMLADIGIVPRGKRPDIIEASYQAFSDWIRNEAGAPMAYAIASGLPSKHVDARIKETVFRIYESCLLRLQGVPETESLQAQLLLELSRQTLPPRTSETSHTIGHMKRFGPNVWALPVWSSIDPHAAARGLRSALKGPINPVHIPAIIGIRHPPPIPIRRQAQLLRAIFCVVQDRYRLNQARLVSCWRIGGQEALDALEDLRWLLEECALGPWVIPSRLLGLGAKPKGAREQFLRFLEPHLLTGNHRILNDGPAWEDLRRSKDSRLKRAAVRLREGSYAARSIGWHFSYTFAGSDETLTIENVPLNGVPQPVHFPLSRLVDIEQTLLKLEPPSPYQDFAGEQATTTSLQRALA